MTSAPVSAVETYLSPPTRSLVWDFFESGMSSGFTRRLQVLLAATSCDLTIDS